MKVVVATSNRHKFEEIIGIFKNELASRNLIADRLPLKLISPRQIHVEFPWVDETGETLEENALLKSKTFAKHFNMPAIADDTGLFIDALDGRPGIFAARYAGEHSSYEDNNEKILIELQGVPLEKRTARFKTVVTLSFPDNRDDIVVDGTLDGHIALQYSGDSGFGYDPLFLIDEDKTLADLSSEEKNSISHRSIALKKIFDILIRMAVSPEI